MEIIEAKILLKNFIQRIKKAESDNYHLDGAITDDEIEALKFSLAILGGSNAKIEMPVPPTLDLVPAVNIEYKTAPLDVVLNTSVFNLPTPNDDRRLCFDFGTAMSKVTLIRDESHDRDSEEVEVLRLGIPGDQEEVSETMLISSAFIDAEGLMWFGKMAVERSLLEGSDGSRQRLDNIKHFLSVEGDGLKSKVSSHFNPTTIDVTYGDMILAYLMYLTWTVNVCLEQLGESRNLSRRFAMPCFDPAKSRDTNLVLGEMLGKAQILADTFESSFLNGIPLLEFMSAVTQLNESKRDYPFINKSVTEPLGVAGALISWKGNVNSLLMVVDIGAGTSDFSLYRMNVDEKTGASAAVEVKNSSEGITEAGNYLDNLLMGLIFKTAGVNSEHPFWNNIQGNLKLGLRDYKERLFLDDEVTVRLFDDRLITINLDDFLNLEQVKKFGDSLRECRDRILQRVDASFINGAPNNSLALALTGGGSTLPMVRALSNGCVVVNDKELKLVKATSFPDWLREEYPQLEDDFPRIAVSLGGARKKIIEQSGVASITAGDVKASAQLDGYYTKG